MQNRTHCPGSLFRKRMIIPVILAFFLSLSSCYSPYVRLTNDLHHGAVWNEDTSLIAATISSQALRSPEGITRLPGGGRARYVMEKVALYIYDPYSGKLEEIADFSDLAAYNGAYPTRWNVRLVFDGNDKIIFQVQPVSGWDRSFAIRNRSDTVELQQLRDKYSHTFLYSLPTKQIGVVGSKELKSLWDDRHLVSLTKLNQYLRQVPLADLGFHLDRICRKSESRLIRETIYLEHPSRRFRRAVVEQLILPLEKDELERVVRRMDRFKNRRLSESEQERYLKEFRRVYEKMEN